MIKEISEAVSNGRGIWLGNEILAVGNNEDYQIMAKHVQTGDSPRVREGHK